MAETWANVIATSEGNYQPSRVFIRYKVIRCISAKAWCRLVEGYGENNF